MGKKEKARMKQAVLAGYNSEQKWSRSESIYSRRAGAEETAEVQATLDVGVVLVLGLVSGVGIVVLAGEVAEAAVGSLTTKATGVESAADVARVGAVRRAVVLRDGRGTREKRRAGAEGESNERGSKTHGE